MKLGHEELCRTNQWCQSFAFAGVEFNWYLEGSRFWLTSTRPAVFEVNCRVTGEKVVLPSSREQGYHGHSASDCADGTVHAFDITILELDGVCLRLRSQNACMNDLVKLGKQAEEQLLWVSQDLLAMRAGDHHQAAAEYHQAEHRTKTMVTACVEIQSKLRSFLQQQRYQQECATASSKIQCTWRQFLQQQRSQRDCAEQDRRNRRQKAERAITAFQRLWRLRQKRRQRQVAARSRAWKRRQHPTMPSLLSPPWLSSSQLGRSSSSRRQNHTLRLPKKAGIGSWQWWACLTRARRGSSTSCLG